MKAACAAPEVGAAQAPMLSKEHRQHSILEVVMNCDGMMQSPMMMIGMGLIWLALLGLAVLGIFALIKYLRT